MLSELDDLAFREAVFTWLRNKMRLAETFTRDDSVGRGAPSVS